MRDKHYLPDIQNEVDSRGVDLHLAGVKELVLPLLVELDPGLPQQVQATIDLAVSVPSEDRGTHMSRLVEVWSGYSDFGHTLSKKVVSHSLRGVLRDTKDMLLAQSVSCGLKFVYFHKKRAPVTGLMAPLPIDCLLQGTLSTVDDQETYRHITTVHVPISTLCPCSKAMSSYGAHNQRAMLSASLSFDFEDDNVALGFSELLNALEDCASCSVYTILKRPDEKYVTDRQYENAKFVEDVVRDAIIMLRAHPQVKGFSVKAEALESIHAHNAWAAHRENFQPLFF